MKKILLLTFILIISFAQAQKKDKIKGSKIVTVEKKQVESFEAIEALDNVEILLEKGDQCAVEIEADDNLHEAIDLVMNGSVLRIATTKNIVGFKKLTVRVTYTDSFKEIIGRNESKIMATSDVELNSLIIRGYDYSSIFANIKTIDFSLSLDDKSDVELNVKTTKAKLNLSKNAKLKSMLVSTDVVLDMYQKSNAKIEGDCSNLKLRLNNSAAFVGKNFACSGIIISAEEYAKAQLSAKNTIEITASGKSEIELYTEPKIDIKRFADSVILSKKVLK